jgi:dimethylargininase
MLALTHVPSPNMARCERTYVPDAVIDIGRARQQHAAYCGALRGLGCDVRTLDVNRDHPDCAFIEDTAVILDEVAILCSLSAPSRRDEPAAIEPALREYREAQRIELPATLEGGDVLRVGRRLFVGQSLRTNPAGIAALSAVACRHGYHVIGVPIRGCLHLKTACTALPDGSLLVNSAWIDPAPLVGNRLVEVPAEEPWAANVALVGDAVLAAACHTRTAELINRLGFSVHLVELTEFQKAEGGATCLSLLLTLPASHRR